MGESVQEAINCQRTSISENTHIYVSDIPTQPTSPVLHQLRKSLDYLGKWEMHLALISLNGEVKFRKDQYKISDTAVNTAYKDSMIIEYTSTIKSSSIK